jgi:hypothetical protein
MKLPNILFKKLLMFINYEHAYRNEQNNCYDFMLGCYFRTSKKVSLIILFGIFLEIIRKM